MLQQPVFPNQPQNHRPALQRLTSPSKLPHQTSHSGHIPLLSNTTLVTSSPLLQTQCSFKHVIPKAHGVLASLPPFGTDTPLRTPSTAATASKPTIPRP